MFDSAHCARRAIKNKCLHMLGALEEPAITQQLLQRFRQASNMTDQVRAGGRGDQMRGGRGD